MFFERPQNGGETAVLVHIDFPEGVNREDLAEFRELVISAGADPAELVTSKRDVPDAKFFIGSGKVEEIHDLVHLHDCELVIFNHSLSPSQERNLERALQCRVLDRTGLILDIFAQRARTHEGKLQVELAQLQYQATRLIRGWTHLERQKGGIGMRGPGETQLETDRRLLRERVKNINARLAKVRAQRQQGRRARQRSSVPTVAIVGYTNAGKSTLFNALTCAEVYAADQLFATLDPTLRRLPVDDIGEVVLADTVGFIRHLPHKLVEAFQATLQEAAEADLLLHVIDSAAAERDGNIAEVESVLTEIDAMEVPQLRIYNKIDLLDRAEARIDRDEYGKPVAIWLSAVDRNGFELLTQAIGELLGEELLDDDILLTPADAKLRAILYDLGAIQREHYEDNGDMLLSVRLQLQDFKRALARADIAESRFLPEVREAWQ
ncbi:MULTISPECIES: ribosome rescue GTPase HflX [unclassified Oceanobacter]|uniref:ribosome rescue GTPase HflX n=1 Tax=unclassified Oceanobacter TaxID=2620260 RepID=UPI0027374404|nr:MULTISPECIES: ribosome rescue GTPase HflX [unclassified Oceanobacter]MDP2505957.1 ribosome rescue GTPase HflX [Oceanobacter sp. 3_MG-2023]MDP2608916.1 ribosome rescue GTPase HflX [Oceanobacter sp. 1_MG-2023]MDP2612099.1 ribosome rescue GTPase HflX [Oceanobacter sp. 2_MG-2023]